MSDNTVPLADVLYVLRGNEVVIVAVDAAKYPHRYILTKADVPPEEQTFTDPVGKRVLQYLARKFDIGIHLFWHTEMVVPTIPGSEEVQ